MGKNRKKKKRKKDWKKSPRYEESFHPCVWSISHPREGTLLFSSTILIVLVLMKSVTVKGGWRAMHHRDVGGCRGRRGRRIRCWRQQRRTLKTNDQWQRGRGAQAHRVSSTFRHRTVSRPCWPRKRFFLQVHALKKSNKPVERSGFHCLQYGNVLRDLIPLLLPILLESSSSSSSWIFLPRFVFLSYGSKFFARYRWRERTIKGFSPFFFIIPFLVDEVREKFERKLKEIVSCEYLEIMDNSNYFVSSRDRRFSKDRKINIGYFSDTCVSSFEYQSLVLLFI